MPYNDNTNILRERCASTGLQFFTTQITTHQDLVFYWGRGNGIMVSVSVCQGGRPGLSLARSVCYRKVEFYQYVPTNADDWFKKGGPFLIMSMR